MPSDDLSVRSINPSLTYGWLLYMHYAKRVPQIRYAFGLYLGTILIGCVTYGLPASNNLRIGVAGREWKILPYPKGNSVRYDTGNALATQQVLF